MGNLLGSPITVKDTHVGSTHDSNTDSSTSPDGGGLQYGISSMQGWRIHMEDAHIAQPFLYAERLNDTNNGTDDNDIADTDSSDESPYKKTAIEATLSTDDGEGQKTQVNVTEKSSTPKRKSPATPTSISTTTTSNTTTTTTSSNNNTKHKNNNMMLLSKDEKYSQIPLPNHSLFAVFDGHGGSFAAEYASRNLLRILCRSSTFCDYATKWRGREGYLQTFRDDLLSRKQKQMELNEDKKTTTDAASSNSNNEDEIKKMKIDETTTSTATTANAPLVDDDKQRLQQLQKRGRESDEKVKQIKEQVKRHFDGEVNIISVVEEKNNNNNNSSSATTLTAAEKSSSASAAASLSTNTNTVVVAEDHQELQVARATYDHELMTLLEHSLRDAFMDLDKEILCQVRGDDVENANMAYGEGYDLSLHSLEGCVGHLPKEASSSSTATEEEGGEKGGGEDAKMSDANTTQTTNTNNSAASSSQDHADHPTPQDDEDAGTTAVVVLTTPKWIVCANSGDSRAVYARSSHRAVPLSYDHKPEDEDEERRIREAGGYVSGGRVEGDLAVSRGLGDYRFKDLDAVLSGSWGESIRRDTSILQRQIASSLQGGQTNQTTQTQSNTEGGRQQHQQDVPMFKPSEQKVSPVPDIIVQNRDPKEDEFIIIACDGIWDVQTNQECVRMVADIFAEGEDDVGLVCEEVLDQCLNKGSKDNMTAAVVKFPKQLVGSGGGVTARRERRGAAANNAEGGANGGEGEGEQQGHLRRVYNPYVPPGQQEGGQT